MSDHDLLVSMVRDGFQRTDDRLCGIEDNLKQLNGTVGHHDTKIVLMEHRVDAIERERERTASAGDDQKPLVTKGDVKRAAATFAAAGAAAEALHQIGRWIRSVLHH